MSATAPDRVVRIAADLLEAAEKEAKRSSRSAKQQLDYWMRVGRAVSAQQTAAGLRVEAALAGTLDPDALTSEEAIAYDAQIEASIEASVRSANIGAELAAQGVTTVALDDSGNVIEYLPDGTSRPARLAKA